MIIEKTTPAELSETNTATIQTPELSGLYTERGPEDRSQAGESKESQALVESEGPVTPQESTEMIISAMSEDKNEQGNDPASRFKGKGRALIEMPASFNESQEGGSERSYSLAGSYLRRESWRAETDTIEVINKAGPLRGDEIPLESMERKVSSLKDSLQTQWSRQERDSEYTPSDKANLNAREFSTLVEKLLERFSNRDARGLRTILLDIASRKSMQEALEREQQSRPERIARNLEQSSLDSYTALSELSAIEIIYVQARDLAVEELRGRPEYATMSEQELRLRLDNMLIDEIKDTPIGHLLRDLQSSMVEIARPYQYLTQLEQTVYSYNREDFPAFLARRMFVGQEIQQYTQEAGTLAGFPGAQNAASTILGRITDWKFSEAKLQGNARGHLFPGLQQSTGDVHGDHFDAVVKDQREQRILNRISPLADQSMTLDEAIRDTQKDTLKKVWDQVQKRKATQEAEAVRDFTQNDLSLLEDEQQELLARLEERPGPDRKERAEIEQQLRNLSILTRIVKVITAPEDLLARAVQAFEDEEARNGTTLKESLDLLRKDLYEREQALFDLLTQKDGEGLAHQQKAEMQRLASEIRKLTGLYQERNQVVLEKVLQYIKEEHRELYRETNELIDISFLNQTSAAYDTTNSRRGQNVAYVFDLLKRFNWPSIIVTAALSILVVGIGSMEMEKLINKGTTKP